MAMMWITQGCPDQGRDPYSHPNGLVIQTTGPKIPLVVHEAKLSILFYMQPVNNWAWVVTPGTLQWMALKVALTQEHPKLFGNWQLQQEREVLHVLHSRL